MSVNYIKMISKKDKENIIYIFMIVASVLLYFCFATWIEGISGDTGDGHYAIWAANAQMWHNGEIPLWNPYIWGGYGEIGHIYEVFYPILLILQFLFWDSATNTLSFMIFPTYVGIHVCIYAIGMFYLCRKLGKSGIVSFAIAELTAFSGCLISIAHWAYISGGVYWTPWLILTLYLLVQEKKKIWMIISGIVLGMIGLCSTAQGLLFAVMIYAIIYGFAVFKERGNKKELINMTIKFIVSGFIGMGLASPEIIPFFETTINSYRYIPGLSDTDVQDKIPLSFFKSDVVDKDGMMEIFGAYKGFFAVNIAMTLLIITSFFIKRNSEKEWFYNASKFLFVFAFLYSIGFGVIDLIWYIPGFNAIREPFLYAPFLVIAGGILAADVLEIFMNSLIRGQNSNIGEYIGNKGVYCVTIIFTIIVMYLPHRYLGKMDILLKIVLMSLLLLLCLKKRFKTSIVNFSVILVICLNTLAWGEENTKIGVYTATDATEKVNVVHQKAMDLVNEIDSVNSDGGELGARFLKWSPQAVLPDNVAGIIGEHDCFAYLNPIYEKNYFIHQYLNLNKRVQLQNIKYVLVADDNEEDYKQWIVSEFGKNLQSCETEVFSSYDAVDTKKISYIDTSDLNFGEGWVINNILEYSGSLETKGADNAKKFIEKLNDSKFDLFKYGYVNHETVNNKEMWNINPDIPIESTVECTEYNANKIQYNVKTNANGVLVTPEFYYFGWKAKIDGKKADVFEVDYAFRGVYVEEGAHMIEFYYFPASFVIGICLSVISLCIIIGYGILKGVELKKRI